MPAEAPDCLDEHFPRLEDAVQDFLKDNPQVSPLKTENHLIVARTECMMRASDLSIHALKRTMSDWVARVWTSKYRLEEIVLRDEFVRRLLRPAVLKAARFRGGYFCRLRKYDRMWELDETNFHCIRMMGPRDFELLDDQGMKVTVSDKWAEDNILQRYLSFLRDIYRRRSSRPDSPHLKFHPFLFGSRAQESIMEGLGPAVMYRNNDRMPLCLNKSFASGMHYIGFHEEARKIARGMSVSTSGCPVAKFRVEVKTAMEEMGHRKFFFKTAFRGRNKYYDPLHDCHDGRVTPIAACLKAEVFENGKWKPVNLNHCVCFVGEYVFDSNQERALVINVESLNAICSSIIHGSKYTGLRWSRELVLKQPFKNDKG